MLSRCADLQEVLRRTRVSRRHSIFIQHLTVSNDGIQRSPKFMAHVREECTLGTAGLLCLFLCKTQALAAFHNAPFESLIQLRHFVGVFLLLCETVEINARRVISER